VELLGGFDRRYLIYGEDVDLCYRLHRMGLQIYYLGSVTMLHHHGASSGKQNRPHFTVVMQKESRHRFFLAHRGRAAALAYRLIWLWAGMARTCAGALAVAVLSPAGGRRPAELKRYLARSAHTVSWSLGLERWSLQ
jgi:GT2 family glycosyltransferase